MSESLHDAIKTGKVEVVRDLLSKGLDINAKERGYTPLYTAVAFNCSQDVLKLLIDHGADLNIKDKQGWTPLQHILNSYGNPTNAKILTDAGADVNTKNHSGQTIFHLAAIKKDISLIEYLLAKGIDVDSRDNEGQTPLYHAAALNKDDIYFDVAEMLLKNGANVNAQDVNGMTPLHELVKHSNKKIFQLFLDYKADVNLKDRLGDTPLIEAIRSENLEMIQLLVDNGSDVNNFNDESRSTPLHLASNTYCKRIIKFLLTNGANINALDSENRTPLMGLLNSVYSVFKEGFSETLMLLLKYSDMNLIDSNYQNILSYKFPWSGQEIVLQHLAKLQTLDLHVHPDILETISIRDRCRIYFKWCKKELSEAKNTTLPNCRFLTFFNLLVDNRKKLQNYGRNNHLENYFKNDDYEKKFPIYGASMKKNFEKGIQRLKLYNKSVILLSNCLPMFDSTQLIVEDILNLIKTKDLSVFCE